jgi:cytochrome b561
MLRFKEIHETAATLGYGLVAIHSAAALVHHYFQRDNTLLRMVPKRG